LSFTQGRTVPVKLFLFLCLSVSYLPAQQSDASLLQRYFQEGERALAEKRYADAETAYKKVRQLDP